MPSRSRPALLFLTMAVAGFALAVGCGPKYPGCKKDADCNKGKQRGEFCVNQTCQQCRTDKDCGEGKACKKGRCEAIPGFCKDEKGCAEGELCVENRCKPCAGDDQCGEGKKCQQGKCAKVEKPQCLKDEECKENEDCKEGKCLPMAPVKAPQEEPCTLKPVFFDFNEAVVSGEAGQTIDANAACVTKIGRPVQLIGKSDPRGTEEYNLALSERRAQAVKDRMIRLGIDPGKLRVLPTGELEATGRDEAGWIQDRRVDFEWM